MPLIDAVLSTVEAANKAAKARRKAEEKQAALKQAQSAANWERLQDIQRQRMRQQKFQLQKQKFEAQQGLQQQKFQLQKQKFTAGQKKEQQQITKRKIDEISKGRYLEEIESFLGTPEVESREAILRARLGELGIDVGKKEDLLAKQKAKIKMLQNRGWTKKDIDTYLGKRGIDKEKRGRQAKIADLESRGMSKEEATRIVDAGIYKERIERIQSEKENKHKRIIGQKR